MKLKLARFTMAVVGLWLTGFLVLPAVTQAADRFWGGAGGNWNDTVNWSTASGGGGSASLPGTSDITDEIELITAGNPVAGVFATSIGRGVSYDLSYKLLYNDNGNNVKLTDIRPLMGMMVLFR